MLFDTSLKCSFSLFHIPFFIFFIPFTTFSNFLHYNVVALIPILSRFSFSLEGYFFDEISSRRRNQQYIEELGFSFSEYIFPIFSKEKASLYSGYCSIHFFWIDNPNPSTIQLIIEILKTPNIKLIHLNVETIVVIQVKHVSPTRNFAFIQQFQCFHLKIQF